MQLTQACIACIAKRDGALCARQKTWRNTPLSKRRTSPEDEQKIATYAREHVPCDDCRAAPGEPCTRSGPGVREAAQDRLRVLLAQAEVVRSLSASVRQAYELTGRVG